MKSLIKKKSSNHLSIKVKFIFILILSNASMFLLTIPDSTDAKLNSESYSAVDFRKDYIKLKIKASNLTSLDQNLPVIITDKNKSFFIKDAFILYELKENTTENLISSELNIFPEYIIHLHKNESNKLVGKNDLEIYPNNMNFNSKKSRKNYEINF